MHSCSHSASQGARKGAWIFAATWLVTIGVNIGWRTSHDGFKVRVQLWSVILFAILFTFIFAKIGRFMFIKIKNNDISHIISCFCKYLLLASILWPIAYSVATWVSVLFWIGPSLFLQAVQTGPFWAVYKFFPMLIVYQIIPTMLIGTLIFWILARYTKDSDQCA